MSPLVRPFVIALVLSLALTGCSGGDDDSALAPPAEPGEIGDLSGNYVVNGFDPLGSEYGGSLTIASDGAGGYTLSWIVTGSIQAGEGEIVGNHLVVQWHTVDGPPSRGEADYIATTAGELDGTRTVEGYDGAGTEQAYPAP